MKSLLRHCGRLMTTACLLFSLALAYAAVPATLNYQGFLTNPTTGAPLTTATGSPVSITFKLYNVASGGTALYTEVQPVTVTNGVFNVLIGSVTPLSLPFDVPYWLEITVGAEKLTPRQPLASSPYALRTASFGNGTGLATITTSGQECTIGEIKLLAGSRLAGGNFIPANGQLLALGGSYDSLFALIGFTFGGDGQTNFALPDLRAAAPNNLTYAICVVGIFP
jgi:hypothetical protein